MHPERVLLKEGMERLSILPDGETIERIMCYLTLLDKWCGRYRLVSTRNHRTIIKDHILDSLAVVPIIRRDDTAKTLCDIGAGAGFPGLCIAMAMPLLNVVLLDARAHRIEFLKTVIRHTELHSCQARLTHLPLVGEQLDKHRTLFGIFDVIVARAVATIEEIVRLGNPLLRQKGRYILHRGRNAHREIEGIEPLFSIGSISLQGLERYDSAVDGETSYTHPQKFLVTLRKEL